jgi:hypothetical protein
MGQCGSTVASPADVEARRLREAEKKRSMLIDVELTRARVADRRVHKMLLVTAGDSGASALPDLLTIYDKSFDEAERLAYKAEIHEHVRDRQRMRRCGMTSSAFVAQVISGMKTLCRQSATFGRCDAANAAAKNRVCAYPGCTAYQSCRSRRELTAHCAGGGAKRQ